MSGFGDKTIVLFDRVAGRYAYPIHRKLYLATGGRIGSSSPYGPMLLLTVRGRSTGREITTPLLYMPEGDSYVVIASNGGRREDPNWLKNLIANPDAHVQVGAKHLEVSAKVVEGADRAHLWAAATSFYPGWAHYQKITDRQLQVVVLEPIG